MKNVAIVALVSLAAFAGFATAQTEPYPSKPVKLITHDNFAEK